MARDGVPRGTRQVDLALGLPDVVTMIATLSISEMERPIA
jgi:hypothetical protein